MDPLVVATALTALGTLILASATVYLAKKTGDMSEQNRELVAANREMVEENRRMVEINNATLDEIRTERKARERPRVIVYVDYDRLPMLYLVIRNVGGSAAAQVTFNFSPGLIRPEWEGSRQKKIDLADELNILREGYGIKLLPAGAKISLWWGDAEDIAQQFRYLPAAAQRVEVEVHYFSLTKEQYPRRDEYYREDFILDPVDVWQANQTAVYLRPSLNEMVHPVIRVAEKIAKVIDGYGYFKIKTPADVKREHEARLQELRKASAEARKKAEAGSEGHDKEARD